MMAKLFSRLNAVVYIALFCTVAILVIPAPIAAETRLSLNIPTTAIRAGDNVTIECQVWEVPPNHAVTIHRPMQLPLTWNSTVLSHDERVSITLSADGVHALTIANVAEGDEGAYICQILNHAKYAIISMEEVELKLDSFYYFPENDPLCETTSSNPIAEGSSVTLSCTGDDGNPPVSLDWTMAGTSVETPTPSRKDRTITSNITFTASLENQNAVYLCYITSIYFPGERRSCYIGPLIVQRGSGQPPKSTAAPEAPERTATPDHDVTESEAPTTNRPTVAETVASKTNMITTAADYSAVGTHSSEAEYTTTDSTQGSVVEDTTTSTMDITTSSSTSTSTNYFFPDNDPWCISSIPTDSLSAGATVTLSCTSQEGNPPIFIEWAKPGSILEDPASSRRSDGFVTNDLTYTVAPEDHDAMFICYVSSPEFPDLLRTCFVGPLTVQIYPPQPPLPVTTERSDVQSTPTSSINLMTSSAAPASTYPSYFFPTTAPSCSPTPDPIDVGSPITIRCTTEDGNPPISIEWAKSGVRLEAPVPNRRNGLVTSEIAFTASLEDHNAVYVCYVTSPEFPDSFQTCFIGPLQVQQGRPLPPPITTANPGGNNFYFPETAPLCESTVANPITEGSSVTLRCTSYEGSPPVSLDWVHSGYAVQAHPPTRRDGFAVSEITFTAIYTDHDSAVYICYVSSSEFPDSFQTCHVGPLDILQSPQPPVSTQIPDGKVTPPSDNYFPDTAPLCQSTSPSPITEGYSYTLSCTSYEGNPPVTIDWAKSGSRVPVSPPVRRDGFVTSEITLRASREEDGAVYICYVTSPGFPDLFETCYIGPIEVQPNPYLPYTTQSPDAYFTTAMMTSFVGQANKTASVIEQCELFCSAWPDLE